MTNQRSLSLIAATALMLPVALAAQTSGTSHPEALEDKIAAAPATQSHYVKPSPAVAQTALQIQPAPALQTRAMPDGTAPTFTVIGPAHSIITEDPNSRVVTTVPTGPSEFAIGTRLQTQLQTPVSTKVTPVGTSFSAVIPADILRDGRVLIPAGTQVDGRVTQIHGGRRMGGNASIRLHPDALTLPDGTRFRLRAQVVALGEMQDSHLSAEGTILANGHAGTAAIIGGATTTTAVIAGAMIGGGVGAVVGLGVGAGAGTILWLKQDRQEMLSRGMSITFALDEPLNLAPHTFTSAALR